MSRREVEDLHSLPCPDCGTFYTTMIGRRDWLSRQRPYDRSVFDEQDDELRELIERARHSAVGRLWQRVKRMTSRHDVDEDSDDEPDPYEPGPVTVTRERIDDPDDAHPSCDNIGNCGGELPITWLQLADAHDALSDVERKWLANYTRVKSLIRGGLFTPDVGFRTPLGTFSTHATPELESAFGTIAPGASPQFVASAKLAKLTGALAPDVVLAQMATDLPCSKVDDRDDRLSLAIYFEPPKANVDLDFALAPEVIAAELRERGATPMRGFGTLRLLDVDWVGVEGKLIYFDFNESLREAVVESVRGGSPLPGL